MDFPKNPVKEVSPHGIITPEAESYGNGTRRIPQFRKVSLKRSIPLFGAIILGNCVTLGLFAILLRVYQKKPELEKGDKHAFNAMALLLSGILTLGIGFLVDSLALIGRGYVLVGRLHSLRAVAYVVRGTLSSQLKFSGEKVLRRHFDLSGALVIGFIVFGILGRLGIAFLGLAFNIDDKILHTPSLEVTPWPDIRPDWDDISLVESQILTYSIPELAIFASAGLISNQLYHPNPKNSSGFGTSVLQYYTGANLTQIIEGNSVSYRYEVVSFEDNYKPVSSSPKREVVAKAECRQVKILGRDKTGFHYQENGKNNTFLYHTSNPNFRSAFDPDQAPYGAPGVVRYIDPGSAGNECGNGCSQIWVWKMPETTTDLGLLFLCTSTVVPPQDAKETSPDPKYSLNFPPYLTTWLSGVVGSVFPAGGYDNHNLTLVDYYGDYNSLLTFDFSTYAFMNNAILSPQANLWVAASISRYTAILTRQLNQVLMPKLSLRKADDRPISRLAVKWERVAGLLGGIIGFQIILTALVLYVSHGSILVEDDVSTLGGFFSPLLNFEQAEEPSSNILLRQVPVDGGAGKRFSVMIQEVPENHT